MVAGVHRGSRKTWLISRPSHLPEWADRKDPREATGQRYCRRNRKCRLEIPRPVHHESGERRRDDAREIRETVLKSRPPTSRLGAGKDLTKRVDT